MIKKITFSVKQLWLCLFFLSATLYSQTTSTAIFSYSQRQGAYKQCGLSSCVYFSTSGDETIYSDGTGGASNTKNARYLFNHPGFTNNKIKKIILELQISKIYNSTTLDAGMSIKVPNSSCNTTIPWSSSADNESLFNCNNSGNSVFNNGIGTGNTSATTFNLLIYDSSASGFTGQTLSYLDPNSTSFTFAFSPYVGGVTIHNAKVHITYESTPTPTAPATPTLSASSNSSSSIQLSWNAVAGATSYQVADCSNQVIATTSQTGYTVTGLSASYTYGYKVRAVNSAGNSAFSACKTATTLSGVTGCSSAMTTRTPTGLTGIYGGWDGSTIGWNAVAGADAYEVWRCETNSKIAEVTTTEYFIPRDQFQPGFTYTYKVRAKDNCSNGSAYLSKFSTCYLHVMIPCQPWEFNPNPFRYEGGETWIRISWDRVNMGDYIYELYNCATNQLLVMTYGDTYQLNNLTPGTQYSFKVRARGCSTPVYNNFTDCFVITTPGCQSDKSFSNTTFTTTGNYETTNSIAIANSTFESGSNVTLQGGNVVVITPDTHYKNGSNVVIKTGACSNTSGKVTETEIMPELENVLQEYKFPESENTDRLTLRIYPNPVKDRVTIESDVNLKSIAILAMDGKRVLDKTVAGKMEVIDVNLLGSGVYIMNIETQDGKVTVEKIIRE